MGIFELADRETILPDEIGEPPLEMWVKLLWALQGRRLQRVGGGRDIPVDVRVIAASNQNMGEMVRSKMFREDLFYRLNVVPITVPLLRERRGDIVPFALFILWGIDKNPGLCYHTHADICGGILLRV